MAGKIDPHGKEAAGARLRAVRIAIMGEDNAAAFARRLGITPGRLNNAETGDNNPPRDILLALKQRYGVPTDFIYYGDERALPPEIAEKLPPSPPKAAKRA